MICFDIHKSPTLRVQCINLAKKCDENNGNNEYSNHIHGLGRGTVKVGFLGFVTMHFKEEKEDSRILQSFTIQSFVLFMEKSSHTKVVAAHTSVSLYDTTIQVRLL